jgi:hypothetical protein
MQFNLTANSSNHLKFSKIGSAISTDTVTLTIKNLTVGGDYQWLVKSDVTDLDEDAIAGGFGEIENSTINILLPLPKANFDVGSTYYFALREFNGGVSNEVIQVSFTISQNAILGNGTSILVLPPNAVTSVNGETGVVVLTKAELGLGNVDNTSDLNKPLSTATKDYVDNPFEWTPANYGYLSWNYDPATINNTTALVNGTAVGIKLRIPRAVTITNIIINVNSGNGLNNCFVALYQNNTLLAQSANQTNWNVGGNKVIPLSSPQAVEAGTVDIIVWCGTSTSAPLLQRSGSQPGTNGSFTGVNLRWFTANTGLTTTAPTTLGTRSSNSSTFWAAVS